MRDLYNLLQPARAFAPTLVQASAQGPAVDVTQYDGALFTVDFGTLGDTLVAGTKQFEFRIQESADGSTGWADCSNANYVQYGPVLVATGTAADAAKTLKVGYLGYSKFIRLSIVVTGTMTTGTTIAATAVLGFPRHAPAGATPQVP